jgi:Kef-type K+ transport system membrane component KefB
MKKLLYISLILILTAVPLFSETAEAEEIDELEMTHLMTILVFQLAAVVILSRIMGFVFSRYLKQAQVLGWLLAGMIIGPYALGGIHIPFLGSPLFSGITPELNGFAVVASVVLLFIAGLETDLPTFLRFSGIGTAVGFGGVLLSFVLGDFAAVIFFPDIKSFMDPAALFMGTISTATSVGITAKILSEKRKMSSPEGVTILAGAVLDDVLGIILLAIVVGISSVQSSHGDINWAHIGIIAAKAFGFWLICTVLGIIFAPKLTKGLKVFESMEAIAGIALGLALLLAGLSEMAGLAMIIGAYILGLSLSQTDIAHDLMDNIQGIYRFLVPIFFCVMGMMVNFAKLQNVIIFGLVYSAIAVLAKLIGCGLPSLLMGFNFRGALRIGAGMLPRGEVTLIIAGTGLYTGVIGEDMFGVAIMTLLTASILAPPVLVNSFKGGSGLRSKINVTDKQQADLVTIELDFPSSRMARFIRKEIEEAFKSEGFFVHRMDLSRKIFHIRKEDILITLIQKEGKLELNTQPKDETLVKLLLMESLLALKDLLSGIQDMKSPDSMGEDLIGGLF